MDGVHGERGEAGAWHHGSVKGPVSSCSKPESQAEAIMRVHEDDQELESASGDGSGDIEGSEVDYSDDEMSEDGEDGEDGHGQGCQGLMNQGDESAALRCSPSDVGERHKGGA